MLAGLYFVLTLCIKITLGEFNWVEAKIELEEKKILWKSHNINNYVYQMSQSCFCIQCWTAGKYILIENCSPVDVQFDKEWLETTSFECNQDDISLPIDAYYNNIDHYYDIAIQHAQNGIDADCENSNDNYDMVYCGGSIIFEYNDILYYPTKLQLIYGPGIADAGVTYNFGCLTVYDTDFSTTITYDNECVDYVVPTPGSYDWNEKVNTIKENRNSLGTLYGETETTDRDYILMTWKERTMDWISAEEYCVNTYDSHLATLLTDDDFSLQYDLSYFGGFVGLNDQDVDNEWEWIDGTQCNAIDNDGSCSDRFVLPLDDIDNQEYCSNIPWGGWSIEPYPCDLPSNQFFCNKVRGYYFVDDAKTYSDAEDYCQSEYGTHLATITRPGERDNLLNIIPDNNAYDNSWIGLYHVSDENKDVWLDGTEYNDINNVITTDLSGNSNCRALEYVNNEFSIKSDNCSVSLPFVCNKRPKAREYFIYESVFKLYMEAQEYCQENHQTDLATIITEEEYSDAIHMIPYFEGAWIGLKEEDGEFVWLDGTECVENRGPSRSNCVSWWSEYHQPLEPVYGCGWLWKNGRGRTSRCHNETVPYLLCNKAVILYEISESDRQSANNDDGNGNSNGNGNGNGNGNTRGDVSGGHAIYYDLKTDDNSNSTYNMPPSWIVIAGYVGILTIIFNVIIYVLTHCIFIKTPKTQQEQEREQRQKRKTNKHIDHHDEMNNQDIDV